jgi:nucleoside-diphosphate-sugar epimerase
LTVYALTKYSSESEIIKLSNKNFKVIALRFATLFGLSPRMRFDLGVNLMTKNILQKKKLIVNGDGRQYRSFVHVKDVAKSIYFFCTSRKNHKFNIYNIGAKKNNIQIIELAKLFVKLFKKVKIIRNLKNYDFRSYNVNFNLLSKVFNNKNFISLEDGIIEMYNFYHNKNVNLDKKIFYNLEVLKSK